MELAEKQLLSFNEAQGRINIWEGSVRSGKTYASVIRWIDELLNGPPRGHWALIGKTVTTVRRNVIELMKGLVGADLHYYSWLGQIQLWGRTIHVIGANDERAVDKIKGATFAGAYCDELTLFPEAFFNMLLSRLSLPGAKLFGTTNPDGPAHWLKQNWLNRQENLDLRSWSFRLEDNPYLPPEYVANLRREYVGLWYRRYIDGAWTLAEGTIYDFWDEAEHVIVSPLRAEYYIVGIDYGTGNPTAFILFGVKLGGRPSVWAEREYYWDARKMSRQKTDGEYAVNFREFLAGIQPLAIYVDPSAASFKLLLQQEGWGQIRDADNSVLDGIRTQARLLKNGEYRVGQECRQTIADYSQYVWDTKKAERGADAPMKVNDHTKDAERYALHSHFGLGLVNYQALNRW